MQVVTNGRTVELIDRPIFNWLMMGALGAIGLVMFVWILIIQPDMQGFDFSVPLMAFGLMALVGFGNVLASPAKIHSFDPAQGVVSVRSHFIFGHETANRALSEIARVESEPVQGNGPEAYWIYLVNKNGNRKKMRRNAFPPEACEAVLALFAQTLSNAGRQAAMTGARGSAALNPGTSLAERPRPQPGAGAGPRTSFGARRSFGRAPS